MIHNDFGPRGLPNTTEKAYDFACDIYNEVDLDLKKQGLFIQPHFLHCVVTFVIKRVLTKVRIMLKSDTIN